MVQRRAARYVMNNYHNTSSVTSMLLSKSFQVLIAAECRIAAVCATMWEAANPV